MYRGRVIALGAPEELKHSLESHHLLSLESDSLFDSMQLLEKKPGIVDLAVFGGGLHVTVENPARDLEQIRKWHEQANLTIRRLESITPSMEDVFVALIEREEERLAS
jgi:ABC-2 type transport system ATP-binding protein